MPFSCQSLLQNTTVATYYELLILLSELRPTELYLNRLFIEKYATEWRNIGLELNITSEALDIIEVDYPTEVQAHCRAMLKAWLQKYPEASWEQLLHAVEATDVHYYSTSVETGTIIMLMFTIAYCHMKTEEFIIHIYMTKRVSPTL